MTVQIGQTPKSDGESRLIEPQATVADRFNQPSSRLKVVSELGLPSPEEGTSKESKLIYNSLRASPGRGGDLLNLEVSAYSREEAVKALETSYAAIASEHRKLYEPTVQRVNRDISAILENLKAADKGYNTSYSQLQEIASQKNASNGGAREITLSNLAILSTGQAAELRKQAIRLQEAMDVAHTYPTRSMGDIYAPLHPKTPGVIIFVLAGAAIGMTLGGLLAIRKIFYRAEGTA